jgi:hypothetical protein
MAHSKGSISSNGSNSKSSPRNSGGVLGPEHQVLPLGGAPKVILWLGSSIGNCDRQAAVEFLQQVRENAMQTGKAFGANGVAL